jgi:integrase
MNFVKPIRDWKKKSKIKSLLCGKRRYWDLILFSVGINTALRISDLLQLRIGHLVNHD